MPNSRPNDIPFEAIFNAAPDAVIITNNKGKIALINKQAETMFGYSQKELEGAAIETLIPKRFHKNHGPHRDKYAKEPKFRSMGANLDLFGLHKNGSEIPVEISLSPITHQGETWITSAIRDVSEKKQIERLNSEQKEKINNIFQNVPGTIYRCLCEKEWPMVMISEQIQSLTGYKPKDFIGKNAKPFVEVIHEDDRLLVENAVMLSVSKNQSYNMDYRVVHKNGSVKWVNERGLGIYKDNGEVLFLDGVIFDITERKEIEDELLHKQAILNEAERLGNFGGWEYNIATQKIHWSDQVYAIHNFNKEENKDWIKESIQCYAEEDRSKLTQAFLDCIEHGTRYDLELRFTPLNKEMMWVRTVGIPLYDEAGNAISIIGNIIDVTEYKTASEALFRAKNDAEAANRAKSSFLANMSHELRTPMNAIIGYSEMLIEDAEDSEQTEFIPDLEKIKNAGKHLLELINDVLDLSKVEAGKMDVVWERINLSELLAEVEQTVAGLIQNNANTFIINNNVSQEDFTGDYIKIKQALLNILSNAAKFTQNGSITLSSTLIEDRIHFEISDTGIGIPEKKLPLLFEEFTQADETTTREYGGTGLGLAITKRFCEIMQGSITVKSELGQGSTFTIVVPVTPHIESPTENKTPAATHPLNEKIRPVLVIEDDPDASALIQRILSKDGYNVVIAGNGEEGLELAKKHQPFAITLDVMMPEKDGWSVLLDLKADPNLNQIPVIMISVLDNLDLGYALGAKGYLTKPIQKELLLDTIDRCIPENNESNGPVLIVDDEKEAQLLLDKILSKKGWHTQVANNGKEALEAVYLTPPSLILLDLMMPVMDGFTFMEELRKFDPKAEIPVIVITARDLSKEEILELDQNVQQIVHKGAYEIDQLMQQIKNLVNNIKQ